MLARYYDSDTGRFLSQETYSGEAKDSGTWNLYVYCASAFDLIKKPSLANLGYLAWDVTSVVKKSLNVMDGFLVVFQDLIIRKE